MRKARSTKQSNGQSVGRATETSTEVSQQHDEAEKRKREKDEDETGGEVKEWKRPKRGEKYFWPGHTRLDYLTNGYESVFDVDGLTFTCVERYMWYKRAQAWRPREDLAVLIREAKTHDKAKQLSRRCTSPGSGSVVDWGAVKLKVMAKAVKRKFECSAELSRLLLATGESQLLYAGKFDAYYGIGFTMREAGDRRDEWGTNYLGEILMIVRQRVRELGLR
jgi:ribA/ribD-fused uncharacterized protein